jgi:hypothetical protein
MNPVSISCYVVESFADVHAISAWGETAFFYNPGRKLPRGVYFATLKSRDGDNDRASDLSREGVFRFNVGISKSSYSSLFGRQPPRPAAGGAVNTGHNFTALDQLMPHPVYAWMSWIAILNPSSASFECLKPLLVEAHGLAATKFSKRRLQSEA